MASEEANNIWVEIETPEGKQEFCTLESARKYLGNLSGSGLNLILNKQQITRWEFGSGRTKYLKKEDVEELKRQREQPRPSNEHIPPKQLLAGAAAILEQVQHGRIDEVAITRWLQMYQEMK